MSAEQIEELKAILIAVDQRLSKIESQNNSNLIAPTESVDVVVSTNYFNEDAYDRAKQIEEQRRRNRRNNIRKHRKTGSYEDALKKERDDRILELRRNTGGGDAAKSIEEVIKDIKDVAERALDYLEDHIDASGWRVGSFGPCDVYITFGTEPIIKAEIHCVF